MNQVCQKCGKTLEPGAHVCLDCGMIVSSKSVKFKKVPVSQKEKKDLKKKSPIKSVGGYFSFIFRFSFLLVTVILILIYLFKAELFAQGIDYLLQKGHCEIALKGCHFLDFILLSKDKKYVALKKNILIHENSNKERQTKKSAPFHWKIIQKNSGQNEFKVKLQFHNKSPESLMIWTKGLYFKSGNKIYFPKFQEEKNSSLKIHPWKFKELVLVLKKDIMSEKNNNSLKVVYNDTKNYVTMDIV